MVKHCCRFFEVGTHVRIRIASTRLVSLVAAILLLACSGSEPLEPAASETPSPTYQPETRSESPDCRVYPDAPGCVHGVIPACAAAESVAGLSLPPCTTPGGGVRFTLTIPTEELGSAR